MKSLTVDYFRKFFTNWVDTKTQPEDCIIITHYLSHAGQVFIGKTPKSITPQVFFGCESFLSGAFDMFPVIYNNTRIPIDKVEVLKQTIKNGHIYF